MTGAALAGGAGRRLRVLRRAVAATLLAAALAGCFGLPNGDRYRIEALKWAQQTGGHQVRIRSTRLVAADDARRRCAGLPASLPSKLGAIRLVGQFPRGPSAFVLVAPGRGALYSRVPAPGQPCI